jgi:hypothetical protein
MPYLSSINPNETAPDATNTQGRNITRLTRSLEMRRESTTSDLARQETDPALLINSIIDHLLTEQERYLILELHRLKVMRRRVKESEESDV